MSNPLPSSLEPTPIFTSGGADFVFPSGERPLFPLDFSEASVASDQIRVLETLWFEERVEEVTNGFRLPTSELYRLDASEAAALGLPLEPSRLDVRLHTRAFAGSRDFAITDSVRLPGAGDRSLTRHGVVVRAEHGELLLAPPETEALFHLIDTGSPSGVADQLLYVAEVKRAAEFCGAALDGYLAAQDVVTPQGISVEAKVEAPDRVRIRPTAEGVDGEFRGFDQGATRSAYTRVDGARRARLVLNNDARQAADQIKQRGEIRGADVARFFDNPEAFLPDGVDLSRFSLRVRGLVPRRYNSQPYVRLQPTEKRDWFALDVRVELAAETFQPADGGSSDQTGQGGPDAVGLNEGGPPVSSTAPASPPHISPTEYAELCRQVQATGERYVLHGDSWIEIDPSAAEQYLHAWDAAEEDDAGIRGISEEGKAQLEERTRLVLDVISNLEALEFSDEAAAEMVLPALPEYEHPACLHATLMDHQRIGYRWMRYLHEQGLGGLLADDMGLGKTVQVISMLAHLADVGELQPALVVLPIALVENWKRELARFCPRIRRVYVHQGADRLRHADQIAQAEVVLTTYETLRRDQLVLGQIDWSVIACDEAQKVKNPTAQATSAVKGMKAKLRLAMTGTPVENGLSELWCIVDWAQPGKLGSQREFREEFERPMQGADGETRASLSLRLQHQLTPHYLRRIKTDVLAGLPRKRDTSQRVPLGPRQQRLMVYIVRRVRGGEMIPLEGLHHLLAVASHPELFEESGGSIQVLIDECPKLQKTLDFLEAVKKRQAKAVVFTRFRKMQQILQHAVAERLGVHAAILNGEVAGGRRQEVVDRFNKTPGFGVLILSPEAAGVGLNITGASHVVHYTRLWNPAKENQATDRVHRIGQQRRVIVYKPIVTSGGELPSVEERLHRLLEEKRALAHDVVRPRESLSVEKELFEIFDLPDAA